MCSTSCEVYYEGVFHLLKELKHGQTSGTHSIKTEGSAKGLSRITPYYGPELLFSDLPEVPWFVLECIEPRRF
jgi:hypothetical protein